MDLKSWKTILIPQAFYMLFIQLGYTWESLLASTLSEEYVHMSNFMILGDFVTSILIGDFSSLSDF